MNRNMKCALSLVVASFAALCACGESIPVGQALDAALKDVVKDVQTALVSAPIPADAPVAVFPFGGAEGLQDAAREMVKSALTAAGKSCVEGKDDAIVKVLVDEIAWDERKEDILDPATVDRFGRLASAKFLLYGWIRRQIVQDRSVVLELELHATEIATKRHVWGKIFSRRNYVPTNDPLGLVDIPHDLRKVMREDLKKDFAMSLAKSPRLTAGKRVACLPIVADEDQYVSGLVRDVLASSALVPVNMDVQTRAEARFALREGATKSDLLLYGALRDLKASLKSVRPDKSRIYTAHVEVQLWIEDGATREILWSDTLSVSSDFPYGVNPTTWDKLCAWFPILADSPWLAVIVPLGVLIALIVLMVIIRNATRVR